MLLFLTLTAWSQFCLTAAGSATPLNSTTIASKSLPSIKSVTLVNNSSDNEQHAHPFCSSTVPLFVEVLTAALLLLLDFPMGLEISLASMLTAATSLTIVPTLIPSVFSRRRLRAVVLPAPRNPARMVIGTFAFLGADDGVSDLEETELLARRAVDAVDVAIALVCDFHTPQVVAAVARTAPVPIKLRALKAALTTFSEADEKASADGGRQVVMHPARRAVGTAFSVLVAAFLTALRKVNLRADGVASFSSDDDDEEAARSVVVAATTLALLAFLLMLMPRALMMMAGRTKALVKLPRLQVATIA